MSFTCMCICVPPMYLCTDSQMGFGCSVSGVKDSHKLPYGFWKLNLGFCNSSKCS